MFSILDSNIESLDWFSWNSNHDTIVWYILIYYCICAYLYIIPNFNRLNHIHTCAKINIVSYDSPLIILFPLLKENLQLLLVVLNDKSGNC